MVHGCESVLTALLVDSGGVVGWTPRLLRRSRPSSTTQNTAYFLLASNSLPGASGLLRLRVLSLGSINQRFFTLSTVSYRSHHHCPQLFHLSETLLQAPQLNAASWGRTGHIRLNRLWRAAHQQSEPQRVASGQATETPRDIIRTLWEYFLSVCLSGVAKW